MAQHEFDIIVYGATSFVGQIMTRYMHTQFAEGKIKWAIAGRSQAKLETLSAETGLSGVEMIVADAKDEAALNAMAARTKVVQATATRAMARPLKCWPKRRHVSQKISRKELKAASGPRQP